MHGANCRLQLGAAALERVQSHLEDAEIRLWPFPDEEPKVTGEAEPSGPLEVAFAAARRGDANTVLEALEADGELLDAVEEPQQRPGLFQFRRQGQQITLLMAAAHSNHPPVVEMLLARRANPALQVLRSVTHHHHD